LTAWPGRWRAELGTRCRMPAARRAGLRRTAAKFASATGDGFNSLTLTGQLVPEAPPAERICETGLLGFVSGLRQDDLSSETVFSAVRNLKSALSVMAPGADLLIVKRLVARLDRERTPRRRKFQGVQDPRELLDAGLRYIETRACSRAPGHSDQLRADGRAAGSWSVGSPTGPSVSPT
jgi:hypothetical protein